MPLSPAQSQVTAYELDFPVWPPPTSQIKHGVAAPVGTVRLSKSSSTTRQQRQIKVRAFGAPARRWMNLARFWWLKHRGPVPSGMGVAHVDGDTLHDDPANYALMTPGDVIACRHIDNPEWSDRQHARAARGTAKANRDRAVVARATRWLTWRWYPVDLDARLVHSRPYRSRCGLYRAEMGLSLGAKNGGAVAAAVFGWPEYSASQAAILRSLQDRGPALLRDLHVHVCQLLADYGFTAPEHARSMSQEFIRLRRDGLLKSNRSKRNFSVYRFVGRPREIGCRLVAIMGSELCEQRFARFTRAEAPEAAA